MSHNNINYPTNAVVEGGISNYYSASAVADVRRDDSTTDASVSTAVGAVGGHATQVVPTGDTAQNPTTAGAPSSSSSSSPRCSTLQFGIPHSVVMAPIQLPPRKKRKTNDEFTVLERLEILSELNGPNAISVPNLAAKHRTSRTSIYRWKRDLPRLLHLAKKADGTEHKKRVPIETKKRRRHGNNNNNNSSNNNNNESSKYKEEFSAAQKLNAVRACSSTGSNPHHPPPSVRSVASSIGANYRALYRWKRDEQRLIQMVEQDGQGDRKRLINDPMARVKEALKLFYASQRERQRGQPQTTTPNSNNHNLTGTLLAIKAKQIRDEMLARHEVSPYLSESELRGMKEFTGSDSWGRKVLHKFASKDDDDDDDESVGMRTAATMTTTAATTTNQQQLGRRQPWNATPLPPSKKSNSKPTLSLGHKQFQQQMKDMKRETTSLKKKLHGSQLRVHELEVENAALRAQIASMMAMMNGGGGDNNGGGEEDVVGGGECVDDGDFVHEEKEEDEDEEEEDEEVDGDEDDGYKEYY